MFTKTFTITYDDLLELARDAYQEGWRAQRIKRGARWTKMSPEELNEDWLASSTLDRLYRERDGE